MREPCTIKQKTRSRDDFLPEFGHNIPGRSRSRLGVASSSAEERASSTCGKLCFTAQRPRAEEGCGKTLFPFRSRLSPHTAEIPLLLEAERAQLGQAEEPEAALDEFIQEASFGRNPLVLRCETFHLVPGQVLHTVNTKLADNRLRQATWPGLHTSNVCSDVGLRSS